MAYLRGASLPGLSWKKALNVYSVVLPCSNIVFFVLQAPLSTSHSPIHPQSLLIRLAEVKHVRDTMWTGSYKMCKII